MYLILHFISSSTEIFCILSLNPDQDYLPSFCSSFLPPSVFILSIIITYVYSFKDIRVNQKGQISLLFRILYSSGGGHTINNKHNKLYSVWEGDVSSVSSVAQSCPTLCDPMNRSTPGLPVHHQTPWNLFKLMPIKSVMPSSHLILCHPLLLLPPIPPSIRIFSNESTLRRRWPKYWSFSVSISPSNEHPGLISFRMDWLDLPAVQGTLKSLLQHHSSKASIFWHSAFFTVQLSHSFMTTGKTIALTRRTFVGKVMSLLFNMLSRLVITFLPRSKSLLISWLRSPSTVILEHKKIKSVTVSTFYPIYLSWSDGTRMLSFKPTFSVSSFIFIRGLFISSSLSA